MARCKDDRSTKLLLFAGLQVNNLNANYLLSSTGQMLKLKAGHLCPEMDFSSTFNDLQPHVLNDSWQLVGTNMWVCVRKNRC